MKKIGILTLVLIFALGSLGVGYAHWSQNLYINGTVETGCLSVGYVWQETDDDKDVGGAIKAPDIGLDPLDLDQIPECAPCPAGDKDVAETTCALSIQKECCGELVEHLGVPCYEKLTITIDNAYPGYNPSVYFDIANCGTVPVNIVGAWIIDGAHGVVRDDPATWIELIKCTPVQVDLDCDDDDDVAIGFSSEFVGEPQQIDPCQVKQYDLHFMFKQDLNPCTHYEFEIKIHAVQWNHEFVFADDLP